MDGHQIARYAAPAAGTLLVLLILLDVYLTVLYARIGSGIVSRHVARGTWGAFSRFSKPLGRFRGQMLSYCGPTILVLVVAIWVVALETGFALIVWPKLGTSVRANSGPTPTDFATAMYVVGNSITTAGASDMAPQTPFFRLLTTFSSLVGISIITLTLTYFLEVYNALQRRNTLALKLQLATAGTGDAAELIAGVGPSGRFEVGYAHLAEVAAELTSFKESHHFYPVLFYFRFREAYYAASRVALLTLDAVTLIKSALDDRKFGWLKESAAVEQLWRASVRLITVMAWNFMPGGEGGAPTTPPDDATLDRWRRRYHAAVRRLQQAGIETLADDAAGAEAYVALRQKWDGHLSRFAGFMMHTMSEIDPEGTRPEAADERQEFPTRLRSAG